jgi:CTP:molybdopterin cytidylyltransferase MocA
MLEMVAGIAAESGLRPLIAVVGAGLPVPSGILPVENPDPDRGLSHSLRLGLAAVPPDSDGAVVLLGDQPTLEARAVRAVLEAGAAHRSVVAAEAEGILAPPVLLPREHFDLADRTSGDAGLRAVLAGDLWSVATVAVGAHPIDIDTPADLDRVAPPCPGCDARVPAAAGTPTHPYIGASPGCWIRWSELLATTGIGGLGRHANDAYAVQHPGVDGRRERQSVAIHLIALCHWLEHDIADPHLTELTRAALAGSPEWPWLEPPAGYPMNVHDLPVPASQEEGRRWAESVWQAWAGHHAQVRRWAAAVLGP